MGKRAVTLFLLYSISSTLATDPAEILEDSFSISRPFSVSDFTSKPQFVCKLQKGNPISTCTFETPNSQTWIVHADGQVLQDGIPILEVEAVFNSTQCGIRFKQFKLDDFGWWSCSMNGGTHKGTFRVNKPGEWPTDIRLPDDLKVRSSYTNHISNGAYVTIFFLGLKI